MKSKEPDEELICLCDIYNRYILHSFYGHADAYVPKNDHGVILRYLNKYSTVEYPFLNLYNARVFTLSVTDPDKLLSNRHYKLTLDFQKNITTHIFNRKIY
jgi:hypothetical protein